MENRRPGPLLQFKWVNAISARRWQSYRAAVQAMRDAEIPFLLGGGFSLAIYTGRWRDTKDIDFYIFKKNRAAAVTALARAGFKDYFSRLRYDRKWIYRSTRSAVIVDIIWAMANQRAQVDKLWFERAPAISVRGEPMRLLPLEELLWCKLYVLQRDHSDWPDVLNLIYAVGPQVDWDHLLWRLDEDWLLLKSLLTLYDWLCPRRAAGLPAPVRKRLGLAPPEVSRRQKYNRTHLLDTRRWFAALLEKNQPLEV